MVVRMNNRELRKFVNSQADDSRKHDALYEANQRIRQLEDLNAKLAAEVDAQRPVVEMAQGWAHGGAWEWLPKLAEAVKVYESKEGKR